MALDSYITLGRSGLRVSPLCLGAMTFGEGRGWGSSVEECQEIMNRFIAAGGNFIDTANGYTAGHSEAIIGDHIGRHSSRRDRLVLATKFSSNLYLGDPNAAVRAVKPSSASASIRSAVCRPSTSISTGYITGITTRRSMKRCGTGGSHSLRQGALHRGLRYAGVEGRRSESHGALSGWSQFIGLQIEYSLLERTVEAELVPMAREFGLGITPWSPLKSGALSGKYTRKNDGELKADRGAMVPLTEKTYALIAELEKIAAAHETTVAGIALAWVRMQPGVDSTIIGARRVKQLEDNLKSTEITLSADELSHLDGLTKPTLPFPQSMQPLFPSIHNGGTTINGVAGGPSRIIQSGETPF